MTPPASHIDLVNDVDNLPLDFDFKELYRLVLPRDDRTHGLLTPSVVEALPSGGLLSIDEEKRLVAVVVDESSSLNIADAVSSALQQVVDDIVKTDLYGITHGIHSEPYRIVGSRYDGKHPTLERFVAPVFGIGSLGAHMTCFVRDPAASFGVRIWVARRARNLFTYPGMLDTTVAGGVKASHSPTECILAESGEEAGLPLEAVRERARATGVLTYVTRRRRGADRQFETVTPSILYVFDMELREDEVPTPQDDEVERFELWTVEQVVAAMRGREFKPNCCLVMLDFFIRMGILTPENEERYVEIATRLHRPLPVATMPL